MKLEKVLVNSRYWTRAEKTCNRCSETFFVQPSKYGRFAMCRPCRAANYHPPVQIQCVTCSRPFTVRGHLREVQRFCTTTCRWNAFHDGVEYPSPPPRKRSTIPREKTCLECAEKFLTLQFRRLYCSRDCIARSQARADQICDQCGNFFNGKRRSDKKSNLKFCDNRCKGKYMSGCRHPLWVEDRAHLTDYRGVGWDSLAEAIRQRDAYQCRRCGIHQPEGRHLDVHHIEPYRIAQNNHPDNLISLCPRCHKIVEHHGLC